MNKNPLREIKKDLKIVAEIAIDALQHHDAFFQKKGERRIKNILIKRYSFKKRELPTFRSL